MRKIAFTLLFFSIICQATAQDDLTDIVNKNSEEPKKEFVTATFKGLRIINVQTIETAKKHNLQFNIQHRFGDIAGPGSFHRFFGLDQATDIRFSFDYGLTNRLQLGVGHSRGQDPYLELYDGSAKFKLLMQTTDSKMPISITLFGVAALSARKSSTDSTSDAYFEDKFAHRFSYVTEAIIARKFSPGFSLEVVPAWVHRNYVTFDEQNDMFFLGAGARLKFTKRFAFIVDYYRNFIKQKPGNPLYYDPISVGVEIETGGHVFQLMFTNATGILENSYLPFTKSDWTQGQFRWGFNLTRNFVIGGKNY